MVAGKRKNVWDESAEGFGTLKSESGRSTPADGLDIVAKSDHNGLRVPSTETGIG
jgi:hypothetical protein